MKRLIITVIAEVEDDFPEWPTVYALDTKQGYITDVIASEPLVIKEES